MCAISFSLKWSTQTADSNYTDITRGANISFVCWITDYWIHLVTAWPDHFLASASLAGNYFSLHTLQFGSNLSDHLPLFTDFALHPVSSTPISDHTGTYYKTNWQLVSEQDIERFNEYISSNLPPLSDELLSCCDISCSIHSSRIDHLAESLLSCISEASSLFFPNIWHSRKHRVPRWNDYVRGTKEKTDFWHKIWIDPWSPRSGVLFQIKKNDKSKYEYQMKKLKRREKHIRNQKLLNSFFIVKPH